MSATRSAHPSRMGSSPPWTKLALIGAGFALFGLGVFAGRAWRSEAPTTTRQTQPGSTPTRSTAAAPSPLSRAALPSATSSAAERSPESPLIRGTDAERKAEIFFVAQRDPHRALDLAAAEPNWHLRETLRNAALEGWAISAPLAAADFALGLSAHERGDAVAAVLAGAARDPESAIKIAQHVCAADPAEALDHGRAAIAALGAVGAYAAAVTFAQSGVGENRADWLRSSFWQWSSHDPQVALKELATIDAPDAHAAAYQGLVLGWSKANAQELANYASTLPPGEERTTGVRQALTEWLVHDPAAAAEWIDRFEPGEEFDLGAAKLAALPAIAKKHPDVALSWAASIVEPTLRASTLASVGHQWANTTAEQQVQVLDAAKSLSPEDRQAVIDGIHAETTE